MALSESLVTKEMYSYRRLVAHQLRAINRSVAGADFLVAKIAEEFTHRICAINRNFVHCCDVYSLSDKIAASLMQLENVANMRRYERYEICEYLEDLCDIAPSALFGKDQHLAIQDNDLVVSAFGLHWENDLPAMLSRLFGAMKKDALLMIALPANGTLHELQDCLTRAELDLYGGATMRVDQFIDNQGAGQLLQTTGFKLPVIDREDLTVRYANMGALIEDLRAMGANGAWQNQSGKQPMSRQLFQKAGELYQQNYADSDGRIRASFSVAILTAWTPHESQQQPLEPGSARVSLKASLGHQLKSKI